MTIDLGDITGKYVELTVLPIARFIEPSEPILNPDAVDAYIKAEYSHKPILRYELLEERTGVRI